MRKVTKETPFGTGTWEELENGDIRVTLAEVVDPQCGLAAGIKAQMHEIVLNGSTDIPNSMGMGRKSSDEEIKRNLELLIKPLLLTGPGLLAVGITGGQDGAMAVSGSIAAAIALGMSIGNPKQIFDEINKMMLNEAMTHSPFKAALAEVNRGRAGADPDKWSF